MRAVLPLARRIHMAAVASMRPALEPPASAIYARVAIDKRRPPPDGSFVFVVAPPLLNGHKQYGVPLATPATGGVSQGLGLQTSATHAPSSHLLPSTVQSVSEAS